MVPCKGDTGRRGAGWLTEVNELPLLTSTFRRPGDPGGREGRPPAGLRGNNGRGLMAPPAETEVAEEEAVRGPREGDGPPPADIE